MRLLIFDGAIAGEAIGMNPESLPAGFSIVEFDGYAPIEGLYYFDEEIRLIPEKPSDRHFWKGSEWIEVVIEPLPIERAADWDGLLADLRGTELWRRTFEAASTSIAANAAWTVLQNTLTSTRHPEDFEFAIGALRSAMAAGNGDFTQNQVETLNRLLSDRSFEIKVPLTL